jgi:hypothetical protein
MKSTCRICGLRPVYVNTGMCNKHHATFLNAIYLFKQEYIAEEKRLVEEERYKG